jgi:hypothetical protein
MNKLSTYILLTLFFVTGKVASQEFAPVGATWVYQNLDRENRVFPVLLRFTATKDTILNDKVGRVIQQEELSYYGSWTTGGSEVVYTAGDSVYVYNEEEFHLVYDFTRKVGDTVKVIEEPFGGFLFSDFTLTDEFSHFQYKIDSLSTIILESDTLKMQYVSYLENPYDSIRQWGFQDLTALYQTPPVEGKIVQGIGSAGYGLPLGTSSGLSTLIGFDMDELTCYSDSLKSIKFAGIDCDSLIAVYEAHSQVQEHIALQTQLFPNPVTDILSLKNYDVLPEKLLIYDVRGRLVTNLEGHKNTYDLSHLIPGHYNVKIFYTHQKPEIFKIIKI